ncbi:AraC family transcriptional regulator [Opitutales bacterium ASA1]|uniref:AraC family transcriptional regulator n=1 Tax=Congregicoccus parvus TaxID=3081749 RepID=UPI002B2F281E|nr:AraC family transcriptional regulator [Opitutales bacterium ASA1]
MEQEPYDQRINRALALMERRLDRDLSVRRLAQEAHISPFHFHRVFSALTGETVHAMTTRLRMQRALALARNGPRPQWKAVALAVGYRSPDVFTRAFKRHFGCTPSRFDLEHWWRERPDRDAALEVSRHFLRAAPPLPSDFRVDLVRRPAADLVVSRATGGYLEPRRMMAAYERIRELSRALALPMAGRLSGTSQDDPELVALSRCRYDFALEVPDGTPCERGYIRTRRIEGRWAMVRVVGDFAAVDLAWNLLFKSWLPGSGLDLRDAPAEEIYHRTPEEIGWECFDLTLALPVGD